MRQMDLERGREQERVGGRRREKKKGGMRDES